MSPPRAWACINKVCVWGAPPSPPCGPQNEDKDVVYHSGICLVLAATKYDTLRNQVGGRAGTVPTAEVLVVVEGARVGGWGVGGTSPSSIPPLHNQCAPPHNQCAPPRDEHTA